jgi:hypothetical protein
MDNVRFRPAGDLAERENLNRTLQRLRQQQATLLRPVEIITYFGRGSLRWRDSAVPFSSSGPAASGAAEVSVPVPTGASSLAKPLKIVGRVFGTDGLDAPSMQLSVGLKYKPFARINFVSGVERLFASGTNTDRWVLRAAYSWDLDSADQRLNQYGLIFTDGAYAIGAADRQYSLEARRGLSIGVGDSWRLSPHALADFRYQFGVTPMSSGAIEGGGGLLIRRLIGATAHVDHRAIIDMLVQYRPLRVLGRGDTATGRWTWTAVCHF